jgi:hypothetical protein
MRKLAGVVIVGLVAVGFVALYPRKSEQTAETAASPPLPLPEPQPLPPWLPPRLAPAPIVRDAGTDRRVAVSDEATLMRRLRDNVKTNPELAEALAREGRSRFADSAESDERDALLVDALINQQRIGAARSETYYYFDHHPNGRFGQHLFVMTGVHPTPKMPGQP